MDHFLTKIIQNPKLENPARNSMDVHKHFTRYSKGIFDGPAVKISQSKGGISIGASFEYEDEAFRIACEIFNEQKASVSGKVFGSDDFGSIMREIGLSGVWIPNKSKGETQNFNLEVKNEPIPIEILRKMGEMLPKYAYMLLSFSSTDKSVSLAMKKTPPRPNSKNPEDASKDNQVKFCTLKIPFSENNISRVLAGYAKDFKDEIPTKFKTLWITNSYEITDLILPTEKNIPSRDFRILTLRKGTLNRVLVVDGNTITKKISFTA